MGALFQRALALEGYAVVPVTDGNAVLRCARAQRPTVIVLDLALPGLDGVTLIWRLRTDPRTATAALIAIDRRATPWTAPLLPVQARLTAPLDLTQLYRAVGQGIALAARAAIRKEIIMTRHRLPQPHRPVPEWRDSATERAGQGAALDTVIAPSTRPPVPGNLPFPAAPPLPGTPATPGRIPLPGDPIMPGQPLQAGERPWPERPATPALPEQPLSPETTRFADTDRWLSLNERRHP